MSRLALALALLAGAAALGLAHAPAARAAGECDGLPRCISVPGPWVVVPASGEAEFLLQCPGNSIVGGTDALVTSQAITVSFDGIPGSPVALGRTTDNEVLFRAVSGDHRAGEFEPFIGCIPLQSGARNTTGVVSNPLGPPLDDHAVQVRTEPGNTRGVSLGCPSGERYVDGWTATAFATLEPPPVGLAAGVRVRATSAGGRERAVITAAVALPRSAQTLVQVGVRCWAG